MIFKVVKFENGCFGVVDTKNMMTIHNEDGTTRQEPWLVLAGSTEKDATAFAERMNLRAAWGV